MSPSTDNEIITSQKVIAGQIEALIGSAWKIYTVLLSSRFFLSTRHMAYFLPRGQIGIFISPSLPENTEGVTQLRLESVLRRIHQFSGRKIDTKLQSFRAVAPCLRPCAAKMVVRGAARARDLWLFSSNCRLS